MKAHAIEPGEKILAEVRRHWIFFLAESIASVVFVLFPLLAISVAKNAYAFSLPSALTELFVFIYLVWLLLAWIYFFIAWTDYYLDVLIITDRKIIDIEQKGIFHREITSFRLERIQNITIETPSFLSTLLDFGHIRIGTAGEDDPFEINNIYSPYRAKDLIMSECQRINSGQQKINDGLS